MNEWRKKKNRRRKIAESTWNKEMVIITSRVEGTDYAQTQHNTHISTPSHNPFIGRYRHIIPYYDYKRLNDDKSFPMKIKIFRMRYLHWTVTAWIKTHPIDGSLERVFFFLRRLLFGSSCLLKYNIKFVLQNTNIIVSFGWYIDIRQSYQRQMPSTPNSKFLYSFAEIEPFKYQSLSDFTM